MSLAILIDKLFFLQHVCGEYWPRNTPFHLVFGVLIVVCVRWAFTLLFLLCMQSDEMTQIPTATRGHLILSGVWFDILWCIKAHLFYSLAFSLCGSITHANLKRRDISNYSLSSFMYGNIILAEHQSITKHWDFHDLEYIESETAHKWTNQISVYGICHQCVKVKFRSMGSGIVQDFLLSSAS